MKTAQTNKAVKPQANADEIRAAAQRVKREPKRSAAQLAAEQAADQRAQAERAALLAKKNKEAQAKAIQPAQAWPAPKQERAPKTAQKTAPAARKAAPVTKADGKADGMDGGAPATPGGNGRGNGANGKGRAALLAEQERAARERREQAQAEAEKERAREAQKVAEQRAATVELNKHIAAVAAKVAKQTLEDFINRAQAEIGGALDEMRRDHKHVTAEAMRLIQLQAQNEAAKAAGEPAPRKEKKPKAKAPKSPAVEWPFNSASPGIPQGRRNERHLGRREYDRSKGASA